MHIGKTIRNIADFYKATEKEQWEFISQYLIFFLGSKIKKHKEGSEKLDILEAGMLDGLQQGMWFYIHLLDGEDTKTAFLNATRGNRT